MLHFLVIPSPYCHCLYCSCWRWSLLTSITVGSGNLIFTRQYGCEQQKPHTNVTIHGIITIQKLKTLSIHSLSFSIISYWNNDCASYRFAIRNSISLSNLSFIESNLSFIDVSKLVILWFKFRRPNGMSKLVYGILIRHPKYCTPTGWKFLVRKLKDNPNHQNEV